MADRDPSSPPTEPDTSDGVDSEPRADAASGPDAVGTPDAAGGPDTTADPSSPDRWLYAGESVVAREPLGTGWLAVTTHRLLVYTPDTDGPRFTGYDRPNVKDVRVDAGGNTRYLAVLPRAAVYAVVLLGGWFAFGRAGLTSLLAVDAGGSLSVVGMAGLFGTIRRALELLELALLGGGLLLAVVAIALCGLYLASRRSRLVVDVAGEGTVALSLPAGARAADVSLTRIHDALASE
ncbi:hypothetical protein SAMN04487949_1349 [Halogranum gelatinilyticum]|uniref:PH domain-containing protein n=1 Tax=Halogranum gelatinilyticum TaxID=660521 RepID=A0A1G9RHW5_9EURY|nr:hypothetical protein [Halogranum gelatinilyticum]SDM22818.1 hypothetical protein SAMN04487949_1349 [Halogranum gelatinilyticum]